MQSLPSDIDVSNFVLSHMKPSRDLAVALYNIFTSDSDGMRFWLRGENIDSVGVVLDGITCAYGCDNMYMFEILHDGQIIGEIGFATINDKNKSVKIDYWLAPSARNKGLIDKFLPVVEELAFKNMGMNKIVLCIDTENIASRKVAERNGYKLDGILRAEKLWFDGSFHDECEYSKLKSDWSKEGKNA